MKQLMIAFMLSIGISSVVMSFGDHGQQLDWDQLNLSALQEQQVKAIRSTYRDDFQRLRKYEIDKSDKKNQMLKLRQKMVADLQALLSVDQQQQASAMMITQMEKRINKRLDRLADKLAMTTDQQETVRLLVSANLKEYQNEVLLGSTFEINQRQYMHEQVDQLMPNILSSDQLAQWQKIQDKRINHLAS